MKNDGGPAFPYEYKYGDGTAKRSEGMTLRDYFAAEAMQSILVAFSRPNSTRDADDGTQVKHDDAARAAYQYADAMLSERAK